MARFIPAMKAQEHHEEMMRTYPGSILKAVENTIVVNSPLSVEQDGNPTNVTFMDMDSVSAAYTANPYKRVAILNFADFRRPGGMFFEGSRAQEESLCHESTLYEVLSQFEDTYYANNCLDVNCGLYYDRMLYSRFITFKHNGIIRNFDVITCAAPNMRVIARHAGKESLNEQVLRNRADFICAAAKEQKVDILVLGAWGCGVFRQDPYVVASAFKDALTRYHFDEAIMAVPKMGNGENFQVFKTVFGK